MPYYYFVAPVVREYLAQASANIKLSTNCNN